MLHGRVQSGGSNSEGKSKTGRERKRQLGGGTFNVMGNGWGVFGGAEGSSASWLHWGKKSEQPKGPCPPAFSYRSKDAPQVQVVTPAPAGRQLRENPEPMWIPWSPCSAHCSVCARAHAEAGLNTCLGS